METDSKVLGLEHSSTLTIMANLASKSWNQGQWKEAEELEVKVIEDEFEGASVVVEGRTSWKVIKFIEGHGKSWNLMEGSVSVNKYHLKVS